MITLNEIKEEEEDEKPKKKGREFKKIEKGGIEEESPSKEKSLIGRTPRNKDNNETPSNSKKVLSTSDKKRENFRLKGRGKSEILPHRNTENNLYTMPAIRITKPKGQIGYEKSLNSNLSSINPQMRDKNKSRSPRFFVRTDRLQISQKKYFSSFTELTKNYGRNDNLAFGADRRLGSLRSLDSSFNKETQDVAKQVDAARVFSVSEDMNREEDNILDQEYYRFLQQIEIFRKKAAPLNNGFLHRRAEKDGEDKVSYKMIRNLRFKIHYNHYDYNLRFNYRAATLTNLMRVRGSQRAEEQNYESEASSEAEE